jgi:hypothetical protein
MSKSLHVHYKDHRSKMAASIDFRRHSTDVNSVPPISTLNVDNSEHKFGYVVYAHGVESFYSNFDRMAKSFRPSVMKSGADQYRSLSKVLVESY